MRSSRIGPLRGVAIVALLVAAVLALWLPHFRIESSVDLLDAFELATKRSPRISVAPVSVAGARGRAIITDRRLVALRRVPVFPGATLRFGIAVGEQSWDQPGDGVTFKVRARYGKRSKLLFTRYVDPKSRPSERRWIPVEVAIAEQLRGELEMPATVDLMLSIEAGLRGDARHDTALWSDLRIERTRWDWPWLRAARRPNVVVISIDTLRADRVGATVAGRAVTPRIHQLETQSLRFQRAYAPANHTLLSHMSLLTGLYPKTHGVKRGNGKAGLVGITALADERITLAETLQAHGYVTAGFVFSCVWLDGRFGFAQGFDRYSVRGQGGATRNDAEILPWIDANHRNPFFLFVHYYDVHSDWTKLPYDAAEDILPHYRERYAGKFDGCGRGACATQYLRKLDNEGAPLPERDVEYIRHLYDAGVESTDREVGRVIDRLEALGILDDTLIVVTSDHGEEFREHGRFIHTQLYEEVARVPLLFRLPGRVHLNGAIYEPVELLDVMPTILDLVDISPEAPMEGRSLRPLMERQDLERQPIFLTGVGAQRQGVVEWPWKLIQKGRGDELYNLETDPRETTDVGGDFGAELQRLRAHLTTWRSVDADDEQADSDSRTVDTDEADVERLRALGYID